MTGLSRQTAWHTGSAFGDYDEDGDLDLFLAGYLDLNALPLAGPAPVCNYLGLDTFCGPLGLKAGADLLYRNNGDGTFTDVTKPSGLSASATRYGFSAVFEDLNQDGRVDLFVANDSAPNFLFLNQGDGVFEESALTMGLAYNAHGKTQADMEVAIGDYDADGDVDLLTTTFSEDYFPLFEQQAPGVFADVSFEAGLGTVTFPYAGWACGFSDLDNDADLDLWLANGHLYPTIEKLGSSTYFQPLALSRIGAAGSCASRTPSAERSQTPTAEAPVGTSTTTDGWTFWLFQFRDRLSCSKTAQPWTTRGSGCVYWTSRIIGKGSALV